MAKAVTPSSSFHRTRVQRAVHFQNLMYADILRTQQTDVRGDLADTLLICNGGTYRVHAFIVQGASPLLQDAMASQGVDYPHVREILLPDFSVKEIEGMLDIIYKGYVDCRTDDDAEKLLETLNFFQISGVDYYEEKNPVEKIIGNLKVKELNRIPQDIFQQAIQQEDDECHYADGEARVVIQVVKGSSSRSIGADEGSSKKSVQSEESGEINRKQKLAKRRPRGPKSAMKRKEQSAKSTNNPDGKVETGNKANAEEAFEHKIKEFAKKQFQPFVTLTRLANLPRNTRPLAGSSTATQLPSVNSSSSTHLAVSSSSSSSAVKNKGAGSEEPQGETSGTDTEDEDWNQPNFKDSQWFYNEARRCQRCLKTFEEPREALICVTSHKFVRCYFCFQVYSSTDILFRHFKRRHKQAGREETLICPFCEQSVPFKSVSCHVISTHLTQKPKFVTRKPGENLTVVKGSPRSPSGPSRPLSQAAKRSSCQTNISKRTGISWSPDKKKAKTQQLTLTNFLKSKNIAQKSGTRNLKIPDMNLTLEKTRACGKILSFRIMKKRVDEDEDMRIG